MQYFLRRLKDFLDTSFYLLEILFAEKELQSNVEELSLRLSLMAASCSEKGETLEPSFAKVRDINYLNNKCVYLEQLLHIRKDAKMGSEAAGNVYIEESNPTPTNGGKTTSMSFSS
ncbi:putative tumor necrosis factor receptor/nerve growth factor receptor [Trypoxylus dichotomus]